MRAEIGGEADVARLVETAGKVARLKHGAQHARGIARIGTQIAVAQVAGGKQRRSTGQVDQNVATRHRAVARRRKFERAARGRRRRRIVVDGQLEGAEIPFGLLDRALDHRKIGDARRRHVVRRPDQHRDVEMVHQQLRRLGRLLVIAVNKRHAVAGERHEGNFRHRRCRRGDQRRHFRAGCLRILRPAGGLADIDERQRGVLAGDLIEQWRFLRAGDGERRTASRGGAEALELGAAQLPPFRHIGAAASAAHGASVERHRVVARADQDVARPFSHRLIILRRWCANSLLQRGVYAVGSRSPPVL